MIRRPPRSTLDRSSAASDVYKRQIWVSKDSQYRIIVDGTTTDSGCGGVNVDLLLEEPVSYTHLRAHETVLDLVCRLLLEKKKKKNRYTHRIEQSVNQ